MPLREDAEQWPVSVYGATKVAQEAAALATWRATGTKVIAARAFSHSGPGQAPTFLLPSLVARVMDAQEKQERVIRIGNATPVRDFLHVQDVARAYLFLALRGEPGQSYNIASGEGVSVTQLAEFVLAEAGYEARIESDPALMRAVDIPVMIGDPAKLMRTTTWTIQHTLDTLIGDMLDAAAN
jgi:GDP-4-dehydro-6-deoxy-D-mannose reductase